MKIAHILEFIVFQIVAAVMQVLPLRAVQRTGSALGVFVYSVLGYRKNITLDNLRNAFPEKSFDELDRIARGAYRNVGIALSELLWFPRLTPDKIRQLVHFENAEVVRELLARGKGLLLLAAHFGNWELLAQSLVTSLGLPMTSIVKMQSNPLVNRTIHAWRTRFGHTIILVEHSLKEVLRALRAGEVVGIVADQAAPKENVVIEFFGRRVPTHQGPAVLSLKTGSPLAAVFIRRESDGSYRARFEEIPTQDLRGNTQDNVVELTRRHTKVTEDTIRKYPDHWLWMHKRWKHVASEQPNQEPSVIA